MIEEKSLKDTCVSSFKYKLAQYEESLKNLRKLRIKYLIWVISLGVIFWYVSYYILNDTFTLLSLEVILLVISFNFYKLSVYGIEEEYPEEIILPSKYTEGVYLTQKGLKFGISKISAVLFERENLILGPSEWRIYIYGNKYHSDSYINPMVIQENLVVEDSGEIEYGQKMEVVCSGEDENVVLFSKLEINLAIIKEFLEIKGIEIK